MIHKETLLADPEWREVLTKALSKTAWSGMPLETAVVKVLAASRGEKNGKAWLAIVQAADGSKPVLAIKYRDGEIPPEERATVPGNNLEFVHSIAYGHGLPDDVYDEERGGFGWFAYGDELKRLGLPWKNRWQRLVRKVCNRRGLDCQKRAVLVVGDGLWFCKKHAPKSWAHDRQAILDRIEDAAERHEKAAREIASSPDEALSCLVGVLQTELHMAEALRKRRRILASRRCWTLLSPREEPAHA